MSFSGSGDAGRRLGKLLWRAEQIVTAEGFALHPDKRRVMHKSCRQEVTGLVVNRKPAVERKTLRRFRAVLQQIERHGPDGKYWGQSDDVLAAIDGFAHYVAMVDEVKGAALLERVRRIHRQLNYRLPVRTYRPLHKATLRARAAAGTTPRADWWRPAEKSIPAPPVGDIREAAPQPAAPLPAHKRRIPWWKRILTALAVGVGLLLLLRLLGRLL
jgi:hypothetical protein